MKKLKKVLSFLGSRLFWVALMIAAQLAMVGAVVLYFSQAVLAVYLLLRFLSVCTAIGVVSTGGNPGYKITWIITILLFPVCGWVLYLLIGNKRMPGRLRRQVTAMEEDTHRYLPDNHLCEEQLSRQSAHLAVQGRYLYHHSGCPVLDGTRAEYFPVGERMFARMLEEMRGARRFILLEYFIVEPGEMWDAMFALLREKVAAGVDVYMMYDDLGSIATLPKGYDKIIQSAGIRLCAFNPFRPEIDAVMGYRDHRKILVVDGHTGFCGGLNLADEYINAYAKLGHWKDTGVLLQGRGAGTLTFLFFQQWQLATKEPVDWGHFLPHESEYQPIPSDGLVQPFGDSPLDNHNVTQTAYLHMILRATRYVYIASPYLILDHEMEMALCSAAQSGIDVRIVTPYIYDKWYVHLLTRSHYPALIQAGVKIYEYTPGFFHGKMIVADDEVCMVGSCNMDFRSLYLHFECSVAFYGSSIVEQVKKDLLDCQKLSHLVTLTESQTLSLPLRLVRAVLKVFAPLL